MKTPLSFWRTLDRDGVCINLQMRCPTRTEDGGRVEQFVGITKAEYDDLIACREVLAVLSKHATVFGESEGAQ